VTRQVLRHPTLARRGAFAAGLVFALLFAQWLGLAHRIAHTPAFAGAELRHAGVQPAHAPAPTAGPAEHPDEGWSHETGSAECRLFDSLCSADGLPSFGPALADAVPAQPLSVAPACASLPRCAYAQAQARAPPVTG